MNRIHFLVCVRCFTFNHAPYIVDALNGFTMQQTTFPFVCTIVDDASTDGEPEIIQKYLEAHFDLGNEAVARNEDTDDYHLIFARHKTNHNCYFSVLFLKYNHYSIKKSKFPYLEEWKDTKYIALCEGDDFWIDSNKLQLQVTYLENNLNCSMCFHAVNVVEDGVVKRLFRHSAKETDFSTSRIISLGGSFCPTASIVVKSEVYNDYPMFRKIADVGDYPLQILSALKGHVHYYPEIMACYRIHSGSWTSAIQPEKNIEHLQTRICWLKELNNYTNMKYSSAVYYSIIDSASSLYHLNCITKRELLDVFHKVNIFKLDVPIESKKLFVKQYLSVLFPVKIIKAQLKFFTSLC